MDTTFPDRQFKIPGNIFLFRRDQNEYGGGVMAFIREDIPSKMLSSELSPIKSIHIQLNFRKKKCLLCCTYNTNRNNTSNYLNVLRRSLDFYSANYENLIITGDLDNEKNQEYMKRFVETYSSTKLIKEPTCFKNPEKNPRFLLTILRAFQVCA